MTPEAAKREEELAEAVDSWLDKMTRREVHGSDYRLPQLFKISLKILQMIKSQMLYLIHLFRLM